MCRSNRRPCRKWIDTNNWWWCTTYPTIIILSFVDLKLSPGFLQKFSSTLLHWHWVCEKTLVSAQASTKPQITTEQSWLYCHSCLDLVPFMVYVLKIKSQFHCSQLLTFQQNGSFELCKFSAIGTTSTWLWQLLGKSSLSQSTNSAPIHEQQWSHDKSILFFPLRH